MRPANGGVADDPVLIRRHSSDFVFLNMIIVSCNPAFLVFFNEKDMLQSQQQ